MTIRVLGVVPTRLSSTRLPRKPLHPLLGRPLIEWVWRRVADMSVLDRVVVATDSEEIADVCRGLGAPVEMTAASHLTGTDRVAEVAERDRYAGFEIVANIQGDEPLLEESNLRAAVDLVRDGWDIGTCAVPIESVEEWRDPAVVKVVRSDDGGALYFSRAAIPYQRDGGLDNESDALDGARDASDRPLRHVGVYAYSRSALSAWTRLAPGALERSEKLEQLRPLAAGQRIGVAVVKSAARGVDTPADVRMVEDTLSRTATNLA